MVRIGWLLVALLLLGAGRAQTPPVITCRDCMNHGCVPCTKHGKYLAQEQAAAGTLFCSFAAECKACAGALNTDCRMCVNAHVEGEMQRRRQLVREWLEKQRTDVDKLVAEHEPFAHLSTTHCELTFAIKSLTVGKEKLETHALMHLYAERIEALRALFLTTLELTEADLPNRFSVFMFREARDHNVIGPRVTGLGNANSVGLKSMGPEYVYSMWQDTRTIPDDEALHRNIVHMVTHLLLSQMTPDLWLGNHKHGWLDEGVAHWFEDKIGGKCTNYCFEEILLLAGAGFKGGRWRAPVRKLVDEGKGPSFATLSVLNTDQLDFEQHAFAFAYVDFLVTAHGGAKFRDLLRLVKQDKSTRDALQAVYGLNPLTIDPQFQQWVKATVLATTALMIAVMIGWAFASSAIAQGPVYRERWGYLHLEHRRGELLQEIRTRAPADQEQAARILVEPTVGAPFLPVAKALANARGTTADESFVLRSAISTYLLPEVTDPEASNEVCRCTHVSVFLPFSLPAPGVLAFDLAVHDEKGTQVWATRIERETAVEDLRMARAVAVVPAAELADGTYRLHVRTLIDGEPPRPSDPVLSWPFHVLRGYQARCEAAVRQAHALAEKLPQPQQALLSGFETPVLRAYHGEAFEVESNAVIELQRLEQALQNLADEKPVLAGMTGQVLTALPSAGAAPMPCVLRLPAGKEPRPLVVFAAGTPAYDTTAYRPTAPATRGPLWIAHELEQFGAHRDWNVAFLDSPGGGRNYMPDLRASIATLRALLRSDGPVVLVCDREAASIASFHVDSLRDLVSGLVLVGAGALQAKTLDEIGALAVRFAPLHGYPAAEGLQRSLDYVARRRAEQTWKGDVERLAAHEPPWPMGLPLLAEDIERFAAHVFARPR